MARLENHQTLLSAYIEDSRHKTFDFPNWNCLLFVAGAIEAITGDDCLAMYKGKFKTERGAAKMLRQIDKVTTSQEFLEKKFGEPKAIAFARRGDIVFVDPNATDLELPSDATLFGTVPGVCYGPVSYFVGEHGLIQHETLRLGQTIWVS